MPILNIPAEDRAGLAVLRKMPLDAFSVAIIELERSPDSTPPMPGVSPEEAKDFKKAIDTMYTVRSYAEVSVDEFVSDVCNALREDSELTPAEEPAFRERLVRVMHIDALSVAAKAVLLQNEHEHDFCDARVLTDARPVYGDDPSTPPAAMIINHILKLEYHQGAAGRLQEIYLSMGSQDIKKLKVVLDRAEKKATSLRAALELTKLRFIDPQL